MFAFAILMGAAFAYLALEGGFLFQLVVGLIVAVFLFLLLYGFMPA
jgi:hypothetical protein